MFKQAVGAAVGAVAVLALAASPSQADPMPIDVPPGGPHGALHIVLSSVHGGDSASMTLSCPQEWSEHPSAAAACHQLELVDGYVEAIAPVDGLCTKEYAPVRVLMFGHWHGSQRLFMETYGNRCEAVMATGGALLDF